MSKYDVYGIGNALVDMEFEINPDFLEKMKVDKGLMTLVDQPRQTELLDNLDGVVHKRSCGGSAANTIIGVSQYGGNAFYSCKVANDETGEFYYTDLIAHGVKTNLDDKRKDGVTGKCMVLVTPDADRTMNTFLGITETFSVDELRVEEIAKSKYVYLEGYLVTSPTGKPAAIKAREIAEKAGVKTALTLSDPNMVNFFAEGLSEMIGAGVDLLFCNEDEAMAYTKASSIEDAAEGLKKIAKTFAITLGADGALVFDGEKTFRVATDKVNPVDSNGAGDLFAASFLYAITQGKGFEEAARLACKAASVLVTQFGARLSTEQVSQIKKEVLG